MKFKELITKKNLVSENILKSNKPGSILALSLEQKQMIAICNNEECLRPLIPEFSIFRYNSLYLLRRELVLN